jgi:hypothetical protein
VAGRHEFLGLFEARSVFTYTLAGACLIRAIVEDPMAYALDIESVDENGWLHRNGVEASAVRAAVSPMTWQVR